MTKPSYLNFNKYGYPWKKDINYRLFPEKYRVGKGEQGVLICQPYKDEILPHWRFKTPESAEISSQQIYALFLKYLYSKDLVGADMARKFLQMGFARARHYANYKGGRKYSKLDYHELERGSCESIKSICASIFYKKWQKAESNIIYKEMKKKWKQKYG